MYATTAIKAIGRMIIANGIISAAPTESKNNPQQHHIKNVNLDIYPTLLICESSGTLMIKYSPDSSTEHTPDFESMM